MPLRKEREYICDFCRDIAGNETRTALKVFKGEPRSQSAYAMAFAQKNGELNYQLASSSLPEGLLHDLIYAQTEEKGIDINIKSPTPDKPSKHNRVIRVAGEVSSSGVLQALLINGDRIHSLTGAPKEVFNKRVPLPQEFITFGCVGTVKVA
jgi:hypothetical protein